MPLDALEDVQPCRALHLFAQPADDATLHAQKAYAARHAWFSIEPLDARSHFPMFEVPGEIVERIESFVGSHR